MKYMGSKARFIHELLPIILKDKKQDQWWVEPFAGGMNAICEVDGNRIANDVNTYLIDMWKALVDGWIPTKITKEQYTDIRLNKDNHPNHLVGWVGFNCSYSGKWFGGFANDYPESRRNKNGVLPNYQEESIRSILRQVPKMKNVIFENKPYYDLDIPPCSIIYCDPPYESTTKYKDSFEHEPFWQWCRDLTKEGHIVFVSEYKAPTDFECIWSKEVVSQLSANGKSGGNKKSVEKLFKYKI
jgi:DNA adenine methylase